MDSIVTTRRLERLLELLRASERLAGQEQIGCCSRREDEAIHGQLVLHLEAARASAMDLLQEAPRHDLGTEATSGRFHPTEEHDALAVSADDAGIPSKEVQSK